MLDIGSKVSLNRYAWNDFSWNQSSISDHLINRQPTRVYSSGGLDNLLVSNGHASNRLNHVILYQFTLTHQNIKSLATCRHVTKHLTIFADPGSLSREEALVATLCGFTSLVSIGLVNRSYLARGEVYKLVYRYSLASSLRSLQLGRGVRVCARGIYFLGRALGENSTPSRLEISTEVMNGRGITPLLLMARYVQCWS